MSGQLRAWHFLQVPFANYPPRLGYGDDRIVEVNKTISVNPKLLDPCSYGLHASVDIMHALRFGKGMLCCRVVLSGRIVQDDDTIKHCASRRRVLAMVNISEYAHAWVRWLLLEVLKDWTECPAVIRDWVLSGDNRYEAQDAANDIWRQEIDTPIEAFSDLMRGVAAHQNDNTAGRAARAVNWLYSDARWCRFVNVDIARANLMERIAPLFDPALLEDK